MYLSCNFLMNIKTIVLDDRFWLKNDLGPVGAIAVIATDNTT